jgi:hypothetical protein
MRRSKLLALGAALAALVATGVAAAKGGPHRAQVSDVATTFTATATNTHSRTCTGQGGATFRITRTAWTGTATSTEPRLAGALTLRTRTVVNEATGDGWLTGAWRTRGTGNGRSWAGLTGVVDNVTHVDGLAVGHVRRPAGRLLGNWSISIAGNTLSGSLGANLPGVPDNSAIILRRGCS